MFEKVARDNLSSTVANAIEREILEGNLKIGDKLPSETALAEMFGVSRNVVRESLCTVKEWGLVDISKGRGAYVCRPALDTLRSNVYRLMQLSDIHINELFTVRVLLEPQASYEAALNRTDEEIEALRKNLEQQKLALLENNKEKYTSHECYFHTMIAKASHNRLLNVFIGALNDPMRSQFERTYVSSNRERGYIYHEYVFQAIEAGDAELAYQKMQEHLENGINWHMSVINKESRGSVCVAEETE